MLNKFVSIKVDDQNIFGVETDKGVIDLTNKNSCLLYTSPSPRDKRQSRMPSSA